MKRTHEANPGEVWEENEFWIDLSWRIDPDGDLGIRAHFESIERPGEPIGVDEYYQHLFTHSIPGLPAAAAAEGVSAAGVHAPPRRLRHPRRPARRARAGRPRRRARPAPSATTTACTACPEPPAATTDLAEIEGHMPFIGDGSLGVDVDGTPRVGFPTPSRKLELYSPTLAEWGWPEYATPTWIRSHVHWEDLDLDGAERILIPTFRLPTLIHTRSGNAKWLNEISHRHPLWIHPQRRRAARHRGRRARPDHHPHRVLRDRDVAHRGHPAGGGRLLPPHGSLAPRRAARATSAGPQAWPTSTTTAPDGICAFVTEWSRSPATTPIRRGSGGPTPACTRTSRSRPSPTRSRGCTAGCSESPSHRPQPGDRHGDVHVDTAESMAAYEEWLRMTRPGPGPGNLRRPLWFARPVKPAATAYAHTSPRR